jgi:hypothetical protein
MSCKVIVKSVLLNDCWGGGGDAERVPVNQVANAAHIFRLLDHGETAGFTTAVFPGAASCY